MKQQVKTEQENNEFTLFNLSFLFVHIAAAYSLHMQICKLTKEKYRTLNDICNLLNSV